MEQNFYLAKPYGLANQKLCYIQMLLTIENLENKTKNVLKNAGFSMTPLFLWILRVLTPKFF